MQFVQILRVLAMLKRLAQQPVGRGLNKGRRPPPEPVLPTGVLINRLSQERLMLYRQACGHPLPRAVRARLGEIVRELDRLWDLRRRELAAISWLMEPADPPQVAATPKVPEPSKLRSATSNKSADRRTPGVPAAASA